MSIGLEAGATGVPPSNRAPEAVAAPGSALARRRVVELAESFATESAFRGFYDAALPRLYGYLLERCGRDRSVAEDLTQAAFDDAIRSRAGYDGRSEPVVWLIGIARHKLVDHFRRLEREERRRMHLVVRELALDEESGAWRLADEREDLLAALQRLTAMQRAVLLLHYADGLSVREVAREIGRSEGATESLMTRAREALRRALGEVADD